MRGKGVNAYEGLTSMLGAQKHLQPFFQRFRKRQTGAGPGRVDFAADLEPRYRIGAHEPVTRTFSPNLYGVPASRAGETLPRAGSFLIFI